MTTHNAQSSTFQNPAPSRVRPAQPGTSCPRGRGWLIVSVAGFCTWAALLPESYARSYIFTWDSAAYIECARSLHIGRGFQQRQIDGLETELWHPIAWWPPGYPIMIALVQ